MSDYYYDPVTGQETTDTDYYYDPVTGSQITNTVIDVDLDSENSSCCNNDHNTKLSVLSKDFYSNDINNQCVTMAVLFNYNDEKDVSKFANINLPEIKVKYNALTKLFFSDIGKGFSSHFLNKIWKGITNLSLSDKLLTQYEKLSGVDRRNIPALNKVKLYKECTIDKISNVANRILGLNLQEFNIALGSVDVREDSSISSIIPIHLFFESIKVGVIITIKFSITNIPPQLIGKLTSNNVVDAVFDFTSISSCSVPTAEIVFEKPNSCCNNKPVSNCEYDPSTCINTSNCEYDPSTGIDNSNCDCDSSAGIESSNCEYDPSNCGYDTSNCGYDTSNCGYDPSRCNDYSNYEYDPCAH